MVKSDFSNLFQFLSTLPITDTHTNSSVENLAFRQERTLYEADTRVLGLISGIRGRCLSEKRKGMNKNNNVTKEAFQSCVSIYSVVKKAMACLQNAYMESALGCLVAVVA